ncbi:MAG: PD-(D/E)XK nuclease family protein [Candidatus Hermodarchaeota archaeon]
MIDHFSPTSLDTLFKCPHRFELRYNYHKKKPPGIAAYIGRSVDASVNQDLQNVIDNGILLSQEQIEDIARDTMNQEWEKEEPLLTKEEKSNKNKVKGECVDASIKLASLHLQKVAPIIKPKAIQKDWILDLKGYPYTIKGLIDIIEEDSIRDTKTSKIKKTGAADKSLQLTIYALAGFKIYGKNYKLYLDYLIANKVPVTDIQPTSRGPKDFEKFFKRLEIAIKFMEAGVFPPCNSELSWWCDPRYCGFFGTDCEYT